MLGSLKKSTYWIIVSLIAVAIAFGVVLSLADKGSSADKTEPQTNLAVSTFEVDIEHIVKDAESEFEKLRLSEGKNYSVNVGGEQVDLNDKGLYKWFVRNYIDTTIVNGKPVVDELFVQKVANSYNKSNALFKYARKEFGIKVNNSEVNKFINEQLSVIEEQEQANKFFSNLASSLGISKREFFYEWEFDNYAQQVIAQKIYPILKQQHPKKENEALSDYNKRISETFQAKLNDFIKQGAKS